MRDLNNIKYCCSKEWDNVSLTENLWHLKVQMDQNRSSDHVLVFFFCNQLLRGQADSVHQM